MEEDYTTASETSLEHPQVEDKVDKRWNDLLVLTLISLPILCRISGRFVAKYLLKNLFRF